jgi:ABC-type sugar transport system ATPase subunit
MEENLMKIERISKEFPGVKALDNVSFTVRRGEIHAIVGENGAGKSTLMNILSGVYRPSSGSMDFLGRPVEFREPREAQNAGIAMIHQELSLSPSLPVYENIFIGRLMRGPGGFIDKKQMKEESHRLLEMLGAGDVRPDEPAGAYSISVQQIVEIAKAISLNARLLIMDEPTSSLSRNETKYLFSIIRGLRDKGVSVLFISHRMEEVFELADRITVFRDGTLIKTLTCCDTGEKEIVSLMVGRSFEKQFHREKEASIHRERVLLELRDFSSPGVFHGIDLKLYEGMVLGITGLVGAGRSEFVQTLFGAEKRPSGKVLVDGKEVKIRCVRDAMNLGIGLIPEGRKQQGLFLEMSARENISMASLPQISRFDFIHSGKEKESVLKYIDSLRIKTPGTEQKIKYLSGGNQQKAILARWLLCNPKILILDEPTHGVDVGAKAEIYQMIDNLAAQGIGVILISSELPEIITMADEVIVMAQGCINGVLTGDQIDQEAIMELAIPRCLGEEESA